MQYTAHLDLPDGSRLVFPVRTSRRSRSVRLRFHARTGLSVSAPATLPLRQVLLLVQERADWIGQQMERFAPLAAPASAAPVRPETVTLPALGECWQIEYRETPGQLASVDARVQGHERLLVSGAVQDVELCHGVLRSWLAAYAKLHLVPWLKQVAAETRLPFAGVSIRNQKTRWGSCSSRHDISLNCKLLFLTQEQVRYVLVHELCHTLEPNHSARFWALVRSHEPQLDRIHQQMKLGWQDIPEWAHLS